MDEFSRILAQGLGNLFGNDPDQARALPACSLLEDDNASAEPLGGCAIGGELAQVEHGQRTPAIIHDAGKSSGSLRQRRQCDQRRHFDDTISLDDVAIFADVEQEKEHRGYLTSLKRATLVCRLRAAPLS